MTAINGTAVSPDDGVAVIGLGKMGLPMGRNLRTAGYRVVGYDVSAEQCERARAEDIDTVSSPAQAAGRTAVALVVVGFDDQVLDTVGASQTGLVSGAAAGYVAAICSTVEPRTVTAAAEAAAAAGVRVVDATLCRGEPAAQDGSLLVMCGGNSDALDRIAPVLSVVGSDVFRLGDVGAGQVGKMLNNYLLWTSVVANYEAMQLGGRLGVDLDALREALMLSSGRTWALETWQRSRPMPWAEKDMRILMQYADDVGFVMPTGGLVRELIKDIKRRKCAWTEGGGTASSMDAFVRAQLQMTHDDAGSDAERPRNRQV